MFSTRRILPLAILPLLAFEFPTSFAAPQDLTSLVNLFIGTATAANGGSGGNVFPGVFPCLFQGMALTLQIRFCSSARDGKGWYRCQHHAATGWIHP